MKTKILIFSLLLCICNLQISAQLNDTIIGDALNLGGNCFLITPDLTSQKGGIWYDNPIDFSNDFTIYYQNNFGDRDASGADGMALVFKTTPDAAIGELGGYLGYGGINNSLIVEFDTWRNGDLGDPFYDHLAIMKNGNASHNSADNLAGPVQASSSSANIEDGNFHDVKVQWDATAQVLSVFFECELRLTLTEDIKNTIFGGDNSVFFGFVGSTGGARNRQEVCFNSISFVENLVVPENENICLGQEINIDVTIPSGNSYSWSPTTGVSDAEIANPDFSPTETTDYTVTITDNCGELTNYTVTITVSSISTPTFAQIGAICVGEDLPDLPTTSANGISGTWLPEIDNTVTTLYTFTPDAGECSTDLAQMTITVNPVITPIFTQVAAIFNGETLAALPTTSNNNITGTWSPAINNTETTTYTFSPDATETCAINQMMEITVNPMYTVTVNDASICSTGIAKIVATPSPAGSYSYTWIVPEGVNNPGNVQSFSTSIEGDYSVSISNNNYLCNTDFDENQLVGPGNYTTVNQDSVPCWETTASDSQIEVWGDGFRGFDAYSGNQFIELNANMRSTLFQDFERISGSSVLISFAHRGRNSNADDIMEVEIGHIGGPYTSLGSFSDGTDAWRYYSLEYIFPDGETNYTIRFKSIQPSGSVGNFLDAISVVFPSSISSEIATGHVSIITDVIPTFTQVAAISSGGSLAALPTSSNNGVEGTWAPAIDNTETTTYTFTPDPSETCAVNQTMTITVDPLITPNFTQVAAICNGEFLDALPTTSNNNITGTWAPAIDNTLTTTYTFTPDPSETFAINETMTITVNPLITPTFTQVAAICNGEVLRELTTTSDNNITGTWSPVIDNTLTTTYTFTPDASQTCAVNQTMEITVNPLITPTFTQVGPICNGEVLAALPTTSNNGVIGTWTPAIDNTATTIYTFAPDTTQSGQACAVNETMTITVNPLITPTFTQVGPICNGDDLDPLPLASNNGITGTWAPAIDNTATRTYTFTPDITQPGQACAVNQVMEITVNPLITPTFTQVAAICNGEVLAALPTISNNGVAGTWSPAIDNTLTTTYTFSPDTTQPGQACAVNETMTITVNPLITPTFTQVGPICNGDDLDPLPLASNNGITGTWAPAIDNTATRTYTFTPDITQPGQACAVNQVMEITVNPLITPTFTQVAAICNGEVLAALPTISNNGVAGTWSPAIDNTLTTTYTFSPDTTQSGQACAVNQTMTITVNPLITPTFTQVDAICNGDFLAALPTTSNNGVTGIWSPAINNTATTIYTFTSDTTQSGQACAVNETMTITVNPLIAPTFTQVAPICNGDFLAALPTTSNNNITGTWSPAINNTATTIYTFTSDTTQSGQACAVNETMTITVNPLIIPTFNQVDAICNGDFLAALPTTSNNGVTGIWSPAINNTATTIYTFTSDTTQSGQACAVNETMTITVNPLIAPTFTQVDPICNGDVLALPTTSNNGVTGTWSPAINNTATTIYTFTSDTTQSGQACAVNETMTITVNPLITPTFTQVGPICNGDDLDPLPLASNNGVTGTWSPAINNTATRTYTFTPDITQPGQACAVNQVMEITVNPLITPTFTQVAAICNGEVLAALPTISNNGVAGTWSPAIDNTLTTTYTFSPDTTQSGQACAVNQTMEIIVNPLITPTFTQVDPICNGDDLDPLPLASNNGVTGTWSPAINNTATTIYTFTSDTTQSGQACAVNETMTITVNPLIIPTFNQVDAICNGDFLAALPTTSNNGVTGTWSPAINNTATTIYTFTSDTTQSGQACAVNQTMTITVNPLIIPTFNQVDAICNGDFLAALPTTSNNGVTGTWSPAINNTATTIYTFTSDTTQSGQACAVNETMTITVNPLIIPTFTQVDPICNGDVLAALPTTSNNNITGTWLPAINNTATTIYTFTSDTTQSGQACAVNETMTITVNPLITPTFSRVDAICNGDFLAALPTTSNNGVTGTWSPAIDNTRTTTYTFTPDTLETCAGLMTLEIVVNNIVNSINSIRVQVNLVSSSFGDNQSIEVIASGGNAPYEYRLENGSWQDSPFFNNITDCFYVVFVREKTACNNQSVTSVQFINHPVFFTPNNDGFNDIWNITGVEEKSEAQITIYDRYGRIINIHKPNSNGDGWDGLYNGRKMPSTDYWFTIEYIDTENIPRVYRSHFSLIR